MRLGTRAGRSRTSPRPNQLRRLLELSAASLSPRVSSRDLREGGAWSVSQRAKNDLIALFVVLGVATARHVSRDHLVAFGRALGRVVHALAWPLRRLATQHLALAFPDADANARADIARAAFSNLGGHVGGVIAALHEPLPLLDMDESSRKILRAALDEGRGVVLPSAHLGPW